jgi:hypothetical protein
MAVGRSGAKREMPRNRTQQKFAHSKCNQVSDDDDGIFMELNSLNTYSNF